MPNLLGSFSDTLAARAVAIAPGSVASANALRSSGAALEVAAAMQIRRQSLHITLAVAVIRGKTAFGISPLGVHQVAAMDLMAGRVRMMSVG